MGCGDEMARIACFAKWALDSAISRRHLEDSLFLHDKPTKLICVWSVEIQAEWDAAVGWLALRFSPNGHSKTRCHDDTSKTPCFYTIAVESDACLVRGDLSRA